MLRKNYGHESVEPVLKEERRFTKEKICKTGGLKARMKEWEVMDDERGESAEEDDVAEGRSEPYVEGLEWGWQKGTDSWFYRQDEA